MECDSTQQIKQIGPECSVLNRFPEIFPRGCDNAQIEWPGFAFTARPALSGFYEAKEGGLLLQREAAHIVE